MTYESPWFLTGESPIELHCRSAAELVRALLHEIGREAELEADFATVAELGVEEVEPMSAVGWAVRRSAMENSAVVRNPRRNLPKLPTKVRMVKNAWPVSCHIAYA